MLTAEECKLIIRFDRTRVSASQVAASIMKQVEVSDFSLSEPSLSSIVKQIYNGALETA
jgi:ABC-2 type transport system ATP-binding protein